MYSCFYFVFNYLHGAFHVSCIREIKNDYKIFVGNPTDYIGHLGPSELGTCDSGYEPVIGFLHTIMNLRVPSKSEDILTKLTAEFESAELVKRFDTCRSSLTQMTAMLKQKTPQCHSSIKSKDNSVFSFQRFAICLVLVKCVDKEGSVNVQRRKLRFQ
jgi:hypothetical protein